MVLGPETVSSLSGLQGLPNETVLGILKGPSLSSLWESFSGATILSDLRDMGFQMRTQDFYDLRREVLGLNRWEEQIKSLGNDKLIPRAWMIERPDIDFSGQAQYRFDVTYTDLESGEEVHTVRAIASDYHYTKQELYDQFTSYFGEGMQEYDLVLTSFDVKAVWTRENAMLER